MNARIRHRLHPLLRRSALLWLVLCLLTQPVLAAWGEIHALAAHGNPDKIGTDHRAVHSDTTIEDAGHDDDSPVHALSHHSHCCGQPQLSFLPQLRLPAFVALTLMPRPAHLRPITTSHPATPFRPPISG